MTKFDDGLNALDEVMRIRLKKLVAESGLSLRTIEKEAKARGFNGLSANNLSRYTKKGGVNLSRASISTIYELAEFFGVTVEYLLGITNKTKAELLRIKLGLGGVNNDEFLFETKYFGDVTGGFKCTAGLEKYGLLEGDLVFYKQYPSMICKIDDLIKDKNKNNLVILHFEGFRVEIAIALELNEQLYFLDLVKSELLTFNSDIREISRVISIIRKF